MANNIPTRCDQCKSDKKGCFGLDVQGGKWCERCELKNIRAPAWQCTVNGNLVGGAVRIICQRCETLGLYCSWLNASSDDRNYACLQCYPNSGSRNHCLRHGGTELFPRGYLLAGSGQSGPPGGLPDGQGTGRPPAPPTTDSITTILLPRDRASPLATRGNPSRVASERASQRFTPYDTRTRKRWRATDDGADEEDRGNEETGYDEPASGQPPPTKRQRGSPQAQAQELQKKKRGRPAGGGKPRQPKPGLQEGESADRCFNCIKTHMMRCDIRVYGDQVDPRNRACERCAQWGLTCCNRDGSVIIPYNPHLAGTGKVRMQLRFRACQQCMANNLGCDRTRPCWQCREGVQKLDNPDGPNGCREIDDLPPFSKRNLLTRDSSALVQGTNTPLYSLSLGHSSHYMCGPRTDGPAVPGPPIPFQSIDQSHGPWPIRYNPRAPDSQGTFHWNPNGGPLGQGALSLPATQQALAPALLATLGPAVQASAPPAPAPQPPAGAQQVFPLPAPAPAPQFPVFGQPQQGGAAFGPQSDPRFRPNAPVGYDAPHEDSFDPMDEDIQPDVGNVGGAGSESSLLFRPHDPSAAAPRAPNFGPFAPPPPDEGGPSGTENDDPYSWFVRTSQRRDRDMSVFWINDHGRRESIPPVAGLIRPVNAGDLYHLGRNVIMAYPEYDLAPRMPALSSIPFGQVYVQQDDIVPRRRLACSDVGKGKSVVTEEIVGPTCDEPLDEPVLDEYGNVQRTCTQPASWCEDREHKVDRPHGVCAQCNDKSRAYFLRDYNWAPTDTVNMRLYCCIECVENKVPNRESFNWSGLRVWGLGPDIGESTAARMEDDVRVGGFMDAPWEMSGCGDCTKLFGPNRRLCRHHRNFRVKAAVIQSMLMKEWMIYAYGGLVCPVCKIRPGIDQSDFNGKMGYSGYYAWSCLLCHGFVWEENEIAETELPGREEWVRWLGVEQTI